MLFVADGSVLQFPAVDGAAIVAVLKNDPVTTERTGNTGVAISLPTSTTSQEKQAGEKPIELH